VADLVYKGALIACAPDAGAAAEPSLIDFQINPESIAHELVAAATATVETLSVTVRLDADTPDGASDRAAAGVDGVGRRLGALCAVIGWPLVLAWGPGRAVPVRLTALDVVERSFDGQLRPTRVEARISLAVLTPEEIADLQGALAPIARDAARTTAEGRARALHELRLGRAAPGLTDILKRLYPPAGTG
jgi:hypothetical protein